MSRERASLAEVMASEMVARLEVMVKDVHGLTKKVCCRIMYVMMLFWPPLLLALFVFLACPGLVLSLFGYSFCSVKISVLRYKISS